jgi:hypothetical protein
MTHGSKEVHPGQCGYQEMWTCRYIETNVEAWHNRISERGRRKIGQDPVMILSNQSLESMIQRKDLAHLVE